MSSLETALSNSRTVVACACAIYYWEFLNTWTQETRLIWRGSEWGLVKVCYLINRYAALIAMTMFLIYFYTSVPTSVCTKIHILPYMFSVICLVSGEVILFLRVYAVWRKQLWVAVPFVTLLATILSLGIWTNSKNFPMPPSAAIPGCISVSPEHYAKFAYLPWLLCCLYDALALVMTVWEVTRVKRKGGDPSPMVELLLKDGVNYFCIVFSVKLAATLNYRYNHSNPALLVPVAAVVASIMCSRLLFRIKEAKTTTQRLTFGSSWQTGSGHSRSAVSGTTSGAREKGPITVSTEVRVAEDRCYDVELSGMVPSSAKRAGERDVETGE